MSRFRQPILIRKSKEWKSSFQAEYLDETSDFKAICDEHHLRKKGLTYTPRPWQSLSYLAKSDVGQVYAAGFIRTLAIQNPNGSRSHFESLTVTDRKNRIAKAWRTHADRFPPLAATHHRLIFSLSRDFHNALVEAGLKPTAVLQDIIKRSMLNFSEKFHEGDGLGYCYGFHHDTDNLHAHVFIHPRTRNGKRVAFSGQLKRKRVSNGQKDKLGFVKEAAQHRVNFWIKQLGEKSFVPMHAHDLYFIPKQAPALTANASRNNKVRVLRDSLTQLDRELIRRRETLFKPSSSAAVFSGTAASLIDQANSQPDELKTARRVMRSAAKSLLILAGRRSRNRSLTRSPVTAAIHLHRRQAWAEFRSLQKKRHHLWLEFRALTAKPIYGNASIPIQTQIAARQSLGVRGV
jgi:hypothetical protein